MSVGVPSPYHSETVESSTVAVEQLGGADGIRIVYVLRCACAVTAQAAVHHTLLWQRYCVSPWQRLLCFASAAMKDFVDILDAPKFSSLGSSLKLLLVAEGEADLYPR